MILASPRDSSTALAREGALTDTVSGTAGREAMLLKGPAVPVGSPPYVTVAQGCVRCADLSGPPTAVQSAWCMAPYGSRAILQRSVF